MGWLESVIFVSLLSLWALVETAFAAWRADEIPELKLLVRLGKIILRMQIDARRERREMNAKLDLILQNQEKLLSKE